MNVIRAELDPFSILPFQHEITGQFRETFHPISSLTDGQPIEFDCPPSDAWSNLARSYVEVSFTVS